LVTVWVLIPKSVDHLLLPLERRTRNEKKKQKKRKDIKEIKTNTKVNISLTYMVRFIY
jgi:hypothetical protein